MCIPSYTNFLLIQCNVAFHFVEKKTKNETNLSMAFVEYFLLHTIFSFANIKCGLSARPLFRLECEFHLILYLPTLLFLYRCSHKSSWSYRNVIREFYFWSAFHRLLLVRSSDKNLTSNKASEGTSSLDKTLV